ncbi:protein AHNAK2 [Echinococcus multilocularis]|uniref:Protein AHNAK2 n=1 Tax=Echinococcus multilocularis TaxID=6211 RepID=A0A068YCK1_ECHMU|nr:protein AHNAK2 [Echinococcus multilocularis]
MQQNPHENTPPSSPIFSTGTQTTATTVVMPPSSTALPHTFDTKGISDIESLPASSSLDRRHREEKKMSTITPATTASSSKPEDEEGDSDLDKLLMESPTTTGSSVRRHHGTSSLRFGSTHSGYSDSGIFETSSPGSTATHSLARSSTTTSKKKQNIRPVVRDMYSEYTTSTPRWEDAMMVERGKTVLSTISIKLRPTMDASISTDDFYFPLDASVLLPAQSAAPLIMNRATISTPTLSLTTVPFPSSSRSDQQTQTELRPLKTKRKSTKHILLFHPSHYSVKTRVEPVPSHAHGTSDQLCAEQTVDLGTSVLAPAGVILVKSTTAATSTAAMEAKPVNQALRETAHGKGKRGEEEEDMEVSSAVAAIQDSTSAEESADSMEASWYQPHLHLSDQTKRFHRKIRRKYKDAEEDMDIGGKKDSKAEQYVKRKGSGDEKRKEEDQKLAFNKGIPKDGINKMEKERQGEKRVKGQREDINKKDVIEIKEKDIRTPQFYLQIKEHGEYKENEKAERKRNDKTTKYTTEAEEEQRKNSLRKLHKYQKKLKGFNMPQIKIKSKVRTPHEELKPTTAKKEIDEYNAETKRPESPKDVSMYMADAPNDIDGNVVGRKKKIPYFKAKVPNPHMKVEGKVEAELEMPDLSADVPAVSGGMELPEVDLNLDSDIVPSVAVATPSMKLDAAAVDIDVPKANVELPHVEAKGDISLMEMEASVPWPEIEGDMPKAKVAVEKELKLPSVHMKAPKFKLGKKGKGKAEGGEVETRQLVVHGERPRVDVGKPKAEVDVEMPSGKVAVEKDIKSPDFHFKMPKMKFGGKVKKPHVEVEAHVDVASVEVGMPEGQVDVGMPKAEVDVEMPSGQVAVKKPHVEVGTPEVEAHVDVASVAVGMPEGQVDVGMPKAEVDVGMPSGQVAVEKDIKSPDFHFKMPKVKFGGKVKKPHVEVETPEVEAHVDVPGVEVDLPEGQIDIGLPVVDACVDVDGNGVGGNEKIPSFKVKVPKPHMKVEGKVEAELEMPDLSADVPAVSGGMELPEVDLNLDSDIVPSVAVATPSMKLDAAAVDIDVPKANVELPHVEAKGDISLMEMEASVPWPEIEGDMPKAKVAVEKELKLPSVHMKAPKFKLGKKGKGKAEGGEVETRQLVVHGERPRVDVGKPKAEVDVEMPSGKVAVEKDIQSPDSHFKMPKMKFGGKVKKPHVEVGTPEVEAHVDVPGVEVGMPEGQVDVGMPKAVVDVEMPSGKVAVEKDIKSPDFHFKMPKMKFGGKVKKPHVEVETPEVEAHVDVPGVAVGMPEGQVDVGMPKAEVDVGMPSGKVAVEKDIKSPDFHFKMPKMKFGGKVKKPHVEVETPEVEAHVDVPGVEVGMPEGQVDVGMPKAEVDVEMPSGKVAEKKDTKSPDFHFKMPKMKFGGRVKKPHVEVGTPEVEAHVDVPGVEVGMPEGHLADGMRNLESIRPALDPRTHEIIPISSVAVVVPGNVPLKPRRQFLHLDSGAISREKNMAVFEGIPRDSYMAFDLPSSKFGLIFDIPSPKEAEIFRESCFPTEINSSSDMTASELESSSHSGSLPISPRDFCAHSTTPEFKRSSGVQTIVEECSGTAERKKSEKNMLDWFRSSWRRNKRRRSGVSTLSGVEDGRSPSNRGRWRRKPLKYKKTTVQSTAATLITSTPVENEDLGIQADVVLTTQFSVSLPRSRYQQSEGKSAEPALPREAELLWAEQKTAELPVEFLKTLGSTKTKSKKKSTKPTILDQSLIKAEPNASTPRLRKSSSSLPSERLQRQTWHHPEVAISSIIDANSRTPPKSSLSPRLDDDISEWFSHAHRSHYGDTSPLRKPRPWSTLDYPPQNCTFLNDDHLFPYSITPTKLPSCRWKSDKEYDVPYIDDDALPLDEPEWALGESRRTLTLTSADADFWRTAIAEEERSEASGESEWASKRHLKKYRSLVPYHFKVKNRDQPSRTPKLVKPPVEGTDQSFRKELETTHHQETPQTHY